MPIPRDYVAPTPVSAKDRAFEQIQEWIINGTLQPGEKLNDKELATAIGISRTPIREALQMLAMQGFITMKPGVSTYVNTAKKEDLSLLLPPSAALQSLAVEIVVPKITIQHIDHLEALNENLRKALERDDFTSSLKYDQDFHDIIIQLTENPYLITPLDNFMAHVRRHLYLHSISISMNSVKEHQILIDALKDKDLKKAAKAAKNHWNRSVTDFLNA
ncbi:MAG: GntR family transcriptional regulator [Eubacteriales bacterium]|nr:GntR family transcriptional regulator [Eubacteriales bacterium]